MKLFETFAGVGSQRMALENKVLNKTMSDDSGISEWYTDAILAYWRIHHNSKIINKDPSIGEMLDQFNSLSLSKDSKTMKVFTERDIKRDLDYYVNLYNANIVTNNFGSISKIDEWNRVIELDAIDLLTYSFPCQDLSTAGNMKGLSEEAGTRSSLLWQVLHLITVIKKNDMEMPKVLLMENVSAITSDRYKDGFDLFKKSLDAAGYDSFGVHLNAADLGARQNRKRYFYISIKKGTLNDKLTSESLIDVINSNKDFFPRARTLRKIVGDINLLALSSRNELYEEQLQEWYDAGMITPETKVQRADRAYKTFNQAKVVVGLDHIKTPTITFQGEFSRIRVFDILGGKVIVRRIGHKQNWELMGFSDSHFRKISRNTKSNIISSLAGNSITLFQLIPIFFALDKAGLFNG